MKTHFLILFILQLGACSSFQPVKGTLFAGDVDYALSTLERVHPNLYARATKRELGALASSLKAEGLHSQKDLIRALLMVFSKVGDPHTFVEYRGLGGFEKLALRVHRVDDRLFVKASEEPLLLGLEITKIGSQRTADVLRAIEPIATYDNPSQKLTATENMVIVPAFLDMVHMGGDNVELEFFDGNTIVRRMFRVPEQPYSLFGAKDDLPLWMKHSDENYWAKKINPGVTYFQYSRCKEKPQKPFTTFLTQELKQLLATSRRLIIDLRKNTGGDSSVIEPLFENLKGSNLEIVVLISRETFSSALLNALTLKTEMGATLIGEPTGGSPSHFGNVNFFRLPHSGLVIGHSTQFYSDGLIKTDRLYPDISVQMTASDMINGKDPVLDAAIEFK